MIERRFTTDLRAEAAGVVSGWVYHPGHVAGPQATPHGRAERFAPGAFGPADEVLIVLNREHRFREPLASSIHPDGGLTFADVDGGMRFQADVGAEVADEVGSGILAGSSVEFRALEEHVEDRTRVVDRGRLAGLALTGRPAYTEAGVEVRRRLGRARGRVNLGRSVSCRCRAGCDTINIAPDAMDAAIREAEAGERVITAFVSGHYEQPVASLGNGLTLRRRGNVLDVGVNLPAGLQVVENLMQTAAVGATLLTVRPYFPDDTSTFTKEGSTAVFTKADLRAIEIGAPVTGPVEGLEEMTIAREDEDEPSEGRGGHRWTDWL